MTTKHLNIESTWVGDDLCITVSGGERPHIGSVAIATPRPSLSGDGSMSCTSSVINLAGHRDEEIVRRIAEKACIKHGCTVVCTGGFHKDGIADKEISEIIEEADGYGKQ